MFPIWNPVVSHCSIRGKPNPLLNLCPDCARQGQSNISKQFQTKLKVSWKIGIESTSWNYYIFEFSKIWRGKRGQIESAGKTGKVVGMRKSYGKGIANHTGPESCGINGNIGIEALTGICTGWVLSPEMKIIPGVDGFQLHGKQHFIDRHGATAENRISWCVLSRDEPGQPWRGYISNRQRPSGFSGRLGR